MGQKTFFESILTPPPPAKANKFPPSSNGFQLESFQAFDHAGSSVSLHPGHEMKKLVSFQNSCTKQLLQNTCCWELRRKSRYQKTICKFIGWGRIRPCQLGLNLPSSSVPRTPIFFHIFRSISGFALQSMHGKD